MMTQGEMLEGLRFQYIIEDDFSEPPISQFNHISAYGSFYYNINELEAVIKIATKLGIKTNEFTSALEELKTSQAIYDRIVPPATIHSFYS